MNTTEIGRGEELANKIYIFIQKFVNKSPKIDFVRLMFDEKLFLKYLTFLTFLNKLENIQE